MENCRISTGDANCALSRRMKAKPTECAESQPRGEEIEKLFDAVEELTQPDEAPRQLAISTRLDPRHPMLPEIARVCQTHWDNWGATTAEMELLETDGNLRVYRRRMDQEGADMDPILAMHILIGVTAMEVAELFWSLQYRLDWEFSLERAPILLETLAVDTLLLHQIHKRVWPAAQRDSVFWSHIRRDRLRAMVVNCSTDYGAPPVQPGWQRVQMNVSLICATELPEDGQMPADRAKLRCRVQYSARLNPGGSLPRSILRLLARREFLKFMRKFTAYCVDKVKHLPVQL